MVVETPLRISLCMIVKNEEKFLANALNSVKGLVDEMILVDTGSNDKTKEIAQHFVDELDEGCGKVIDFVWIDDFSAARNEALKYASGDWILVLDADETISHSDHERIRTTIRAAEAKGIFGISLIQRNYLNDARQRFFQSSHGDKYVESEPFLGWDANPLTRLFKNKQGFQFVYPVHELIEPAIVQSGSKILKTRIPIHHYGKVNAKDVVQRKAPQYLEIGGDKIKKFPTDARGYSELGVHYIVHGDLAQAKEMFVKTLELNPHDPTAPSYLIDVCGRLRQFDEVIKYYKKGLEIAPDDKDLYLNMGLVFLNAKKFESAIKCYSKAVSLDRTNILGFLGLGMCHAELGNIPAAKACFEYVLRLDPNNLGAKEWLKKMVD